GLCCIPAPRQRFREPSVPPFDEPPPREPLGKGGKPGGMGTGEKPAKIAHPRHPRLLPPCRERPRHRRSAEKRDEPAAVHSITSSARSRRASDILSPSALAVVRLMTRSNLVGCCTRSSAGLAPRRILPT